MKIDDGKGGCRCPDDYESDGTWGGCKLIDPCMNVSCPDAQKCVEGDCVNCPLGEDCGCFEDDAFSNGDGICEPNVHECDPGKAYNTETRACEDCAENDDCGCFEEGGYADGKGGCKIICKDWEYWDGSKCVPAVGACNTSADCVSGNYCLDHSCRPGCEKTSDCQKGTYCKNNTCIEGCESDDDCKIGSTGAYCENNTCASGCKNNDNCPDYRGCFDGICKHPCEASGTNPCTNPKYPKCSAYGMGGTSFYCTCTSTSCGDNLECQKSGYTIKPNQTDAGTCRPKGGVCENDDVCDYGKYCYDGVCQTPCEHNNPCTDPKYPTCIGHSKNSPPFCRCTETSCGDGYQCSRVGKCEAIGGICTEDSDCGSFENCYNGVCKKPCDDTPCTNSKYPTCENKYMGSGEHSYGYVCKCTSTSCGSNYKCETTSSGVSYDTNSPDSGLCKVLQTESCTTDENCSAEKKCRDGYCIFRDVCVKDADCGSNERCSENGYCVIK